MRGAARTVAIVLGALVAGCSPATGAATGDVPTYRGDPARTGIMPGPGPSGEPDVLWQFHADGPIQSSPAVLGSTIFAASTDGVVHALELPTGRERWTTDVGAEFGSATPLVIDGRVVLGDRDGIVHALDPDTGKERWRAVTDGPIAGAAAEFDGSIVAATESGVAYRIDPTSGEIAWRGSLPGGVSRSITATDELVYCAVSGGLLVALTARDKSPAWQAAVAMDGEGGTPTVADGLVFAATGMDIHDPAAKGVVALDASTGQERWRRPSPTGEVMYTPAVVDGTAYIVSEDETVVAVNAATGEVQWSTTADAQIDALPAVWGSTLYVATMGGTLLALDTSTGALLWDVDITGVPYAPVVTSGLVLVGTNAGVLYAFGEVTS